MCDHRHLNNGGIGKVAGGEHTSHNAHLNTARPTAFLESPAALFDFLPLCTAPTLAYMTLSRGKPSPRAINSIGAIMTPPAKKQQQDKQIELNRLKMVASEVGRQAKKNSANAEQRRTNLCRLVSLAWRAERFIYRVVETMPQKHKKPSDILDAGTSFATQLTCNFDVPD